MTLMMVMVKMKMVKIVMVVKTVRMVMMLKMVKMLMMVMIVKKMEMVMLMCSCLTSMQTCCNRRISRGTRRPQSWPHLLVWKFNFRGADDMDGGGDDSDDGDDRHEAH